MSTILWNVCYLKVMKLINSLIDHRDKKSSSLDSKTSKLLTVNYYN